MGILSRLRTRIARMLLEGVEIEELGVKKLQRGDKTIYITGSYVDLALLTADPTLVEGRMWYRDDLGRMRYYNGVDVISLDPPLTAAEVWGYPRRCLNVGLLHRERTSEEVIYRASVYFWADRTTVRGELEGTLGKGLLTDEDEDEVQTATETVLYTGFDTAPVKDWDLDTYENLVDSIAPGEVRDLAKWDFGTVATRAVFAKLYSYSVAILVRVLISDDDVTYTTLFEVSNATKLLLDNASFRYLKLQAENTAALSVGADTGRFYTVEVYSPAGSLPYERTISKTTTGKRLVSLLYTGDETIDAYLWKEQEPSQFPFWSAIIEQTYGTVSVGAGATVDVSIQPPAGETWLVEFLAKLSGLDVRVVYRDYDGTTARHHGDLYDYDFYTSGYPWKGLNAVSRILTNALFAQIRYINKSGSSQTGRYGYSGFKLSQPLWSPRRIHNPEDRPLKRPRTEPLPEELQALDGYAYEILDLDPERPDEYALGIILEEETVLAEDPATGFPVETMSAYITVDNLLTLLQKRDHPELRPDVVIDTGRFKGRRLRDLSPAEFEEFTGHRKYLQRWRDEGIEL